MGHAYHTPLSKGTTILVSKIPLYHTAYISQGRMDTHIEATCTTRRSLTKLQRRTGIRSRKFQTPISAQVPHTLRQGTPVPQRPSNRKIQIWGLLRSVKVHFCANVYGSHKCPKRKSERPLQAASCCIFPNSAPPDREFPTTCTTRGRQP